MKWPEDNLAGNLRNVCRLCMAEGTECMQHIFAECEHDGEKFQLSSRITAVTSLKVEPGDRLPEQACQDCVAQIIRWYDFKTLCENSDMMLRQQLSNSRSEGDEITDFSAVGSTVSGGLIFNGYSLSAGSPQEEPVTNGFSVSYPFLCTLCEAGFERKSQLKQHIAEHCGEPPHPCRRCSAGFNEKSDLTKHMRQHTAPIRQTRRHEMVHYPCSVCNTSFRCPQSLLHHQTSHTNASRLHCIFCSRVCTSTVQLRFHLRRHVMHRRYCSTCQRIFSSVALLRQHKCDKINAKPFSKVESIS